ncbi:DMT family transporter [Saccharothrix violaceirubra]|uniref:Drug/metabolite transporter (DMT)-like permease n=1 Tax=Saccharothrix violaceirubra TaxID=413306 RepID=A0A7W7WT89_9PSEU|nr:DMT family transporter [Saccharothrix violaceirubra]MBB4962971.1 drug/metabolite transporter (DMT)-like permease [Saccharothrix violaceirubra]
MNNRGTLVRLGVLALLWGSSYFWIKIALTGFSPVQIAFGRTVLGALVLVALAYSRGHRLTRDRRVWGHLAVAALFANLIPFVLFGIGEQSVDSGVAGVLNATTPLWTLTLGLALGFERNRNPVRLAGLLLGFVGTLLIFAPWQKGGLASWGALACLAAAASYAVAYTYIGRTLSGRGLSSIGLSSAQLVAATGLTAVVVPVGGLQPMHPDWRSVLAVVILGVFGTGLAYMINYRLIEDEGPTNATTVGYLLPVVSVLLGAAVLDEELNLRVVAGMLVVLVGVALTRRQPATAVTPVEEPATTRK